MIESVGVRGAPIASAVALARAGIFDEYMVYERDGVWNVAGGCQAAVTLDAGHVRVRHRDDERSLPWHSQPLSRLGEGLAGLPLPEWTAYGWLTFEVAHLLAGRNDLAGAGELARLIVPRAEVRISSGAATISCADPQLRRHVREVLANVVPQPPPRPRKIDIDIAGELYQRAVADAVDKIRRGSFQKVILSRRVPVSGTLDFPGTYLLGRASNTPARSFLLNIGRYQAAGFCPETILEAVPDRTVSTQPLAGTRSFGNGQDQDNLLRAQLLNDPKEVYEHAVSVKIAHDELQEVCEPKTVSVTDLMSVKPRGSVQHLASRVRGELAADRTAWDALETLFPAVTSSGIPKNAACAYIARAEPRRRGLYSGAVLMATRAGSLDAGLVLRSVYEENGRRWLQAGAGIVGASRPEREYEETCEKMRSIAACLVERPTE